MPERTNKAGMSGVCHASTDGRPASSMPVYATTTTPISTPRTPPGTANFSRRSHISSIFVHANTVESAHATASACRDCRGSRSRKQKKRAIDSAEVGEQAHDRKPQHDCACSPCPREEFRRQKPTTGSKARRIQRLEQREHRKRPTTRATQKQVRHDERIEYAHALPFSTRQRHDAPVRCHIVAIRCVKYSRSAASETMFKKSPECPARSRCISNKCTATAKKPTLSSRLFVSDPRCMKPLRATDLQLTCSRPTRLRRPWRWQLPSSRRCERECSRTQRPRCCATR